MAVAQRHYHSPLCIYYHRLHTSTTHFVTHTASSLQSNVAWTTLGYFVVAVQPYPFVQVEGMGVSGVHNYLVFYPALREV